MSELAREWFEGGSMFEWVPQEAMRRTERLNIFHAEFGDPDAPVVLLVHGFPTSSVDWHQVVKTLSENHRVCLLDFPGFGLSDKPKDESYTLTRDAELLDHYLREVVGAERGAVVAHDRGDSVSLALLRRCESGVSSFEITNLLLSNANIFLPMSNLTSFQRMILDPSSAPAVLEAITPEALATGMGMTTYTPIRGLDDPSIRAMADMFAANDGTKVLHDTIQYLVERSENETMWLDALAQSSVPTTLVWGIYDTVSPMRVANYVWQTYLSRKPGDNSFWILPRANHYLQEDQPEQFAAVVDAALAGRIDVAPGPMSDEPGAALFVDRSREGLPSAKDALAGL